MITLFSEQHVQHAPRHEFFRGERVPCFESPARARFVQQQLVARGHLLREPDADSRPVLAQVHTARYLAFPFHLSLRQLLRELPMAILAGFAALAGELRGWRSEFARIAGR